VNLGACRHHGRILRKGSETEQERGAHGQASCESSHQIPPLKSSADTLSV
jgi:hypothetical protein